MMMPFNEMVMFEMIENHLIVVILTARGIHGGNAAGVNAVRFSCGVLVITVVSRNTLYRNNSKKTKLHNCVWPWSSSTGKCCLKS